MAVNCINAFLDPDNNPIVFLAPNTLYEGTVNNQFDADFYKFEMFENETMSFTIRILPKTIQGISATLTLYRKLSETEYVGLGTSNMSEFYNTFNYDGTPGEYAFCIKNAGGAYDYEMTVGFTDYPFTLITSMDAYAGSYMPPTEFARPTAFCEGDVFYRLIEGQLPVGLDLDPGGLVLGVPEELDCVTDPGAPPSFTWHKTLDDGTVVPTSEDARIVIRAALVDDPNVFADREFFICVHNNWDFDRDAFMGSQPQWERQVFIRRGEEPKGELVAPDSNVDRNLALLKRAEAEANPQLPLPPKVEQATEEEIAAARAVAIINPEFAGIIEINSEGLCVVCEEPEPELIVINLVEVEALCEPCVEPTPIIGLQQLPKSLCPCEIEQIEIVDPGESEFVLGIPELCFFDLIQDMKTLKICRGPLVCPEKPPIYPAPLTPKRLLPESLCTPCEDE